MFMEQEQCPACFLSVKTIVVSDYHFKTQNKASDGAHIGPNTLRNLPYSFKYIIYAKRSYRPHKK